MNNMESIIAIVMLGLVEITAIVGFVYLACYFEHWWIALFSILFSFSLHRHSEE